MEKTSKVVVLVREHRALHVVDEVELRQLALVLHHLELQFVQSLIYVLFFIVPRNASLLRLVPIAKYQVAKLEQGLGKYAEAFWLHQ